MRVGILTGGGDCPGLNAVIRAAVLAGTQRHGMEFVGFLDGWRGVLDGDTVPLDEETVRPLLTIGGTILGSSRTNPLADGVDDGVARVRKQLTALEVDALLAIGGEDTLGVATALHAAGIPVVGAPKTIDDDLSATDATFGFDTAVQTAVDACDRLATTGASHHRAMIVEVMGRHAGWIALHTGMAAGAHVTILPEEDPDLDAVADVTRSVLARGQAPSSSSARARRSTARKPRRTPRGTPSDTPSSAGPATPWSTSSSPASRGCRRGSPSWATCCGAGPRRRPTGSSRRGSGCRRSRRSRAGTWARWRPCTGSRSTRCRWPRPPGCCARCPTRDGPRRPASGGDARSRVWQPHPAGVRHLPA